MKYGIELERLDWREALDERGINIGLDNWCWLWSVKVGAGRLSGWDRTERRAWRSARRAIRTWCDEGWKMECA